MRPLPLLALPLVLALLAGAAAGLGPLHPDEPDNPDQPGSGYPPPAPEPPAGNNPPPGPPAPAPQPTPPAPAPPPPAPPAPSPQPPDAGGDPGEPPAEPPGPTPGFSPLLPVSGTPPAPIACPGGFQSLAAGEVDALLRAAAAAIDRPLTVAVVDRAGRPLGLYRRGQGGSEDDRAVALARTGAFFSNNQAPLSSRTVRFVSGIHFPPGIPNTPNAALYGIENTNRGCDLQAAYHPGQELPPARSVVHSGPCTPFDGSACGRGPATGKADAFDGDSGAVDPGGLPIYRGKGLIGGIGVASAPDASEYAAFAALMAVPGLAPLPQPLPFPGVVFIDGIRLPYVEQVDPPVGPGDPSAGAVVGGPFAGGCAPEGYLVGPDSGLSLSSGEVDGIVAAAVAAAERTRAVIRLPIGSRTRMVISVTDLDGRILALFRMSDATVFSADVAVAKARNVVHFTRDPGDLPGLPAGTAVSSRTLGFGAQPLYPPGIDGSGPGPFFGLFQQDRATPCRQGSAAPQAYQNGIVFFPGSLPLFRGGQLVGGLGVSGDGVEQDDYVTYLGAGGFAPPEDIWADRLFVGGVRLPFLKFPRNPEQ